MPHQCVRCGVFYEDGSSHILSGCKCGGKLFFFVSKSKLEKAKSVQLTLTVPEKEKMERDALELVHVHDEDKEDNEPVVLDFESINVKAPGKFELDIVKLFQKDNQLVYKVSEGKYIIDLPKSFKKRK